MSNTSNLYGATVSNENVVNATYTVTLFGSETIQTKSDAWSDATLTAAKTLFDLCQSGAQGMGDLSYVQVYTPSSDKDGCPPYSASGEVVDIFFTSGPNSFRIGSTVSVPANIAAARDALKTAIQADLSS